MRFFAVYGISKGACACREGAKCATPGKHPVGFWRTEPRDPKDGDNHGVATGDGFWVLDIDVSGDKQGLATLQSLIEIHGVLPKTLTVITGSGGCHYYFKGSGVPNSTNRVGLGIDVRGSGGFVVTPPSNHVLGGVYKWLTPPDTLIAEAPAWLRDLATAAPAKIRDRATDAAAKEARSRIPPLQRLLRAEAYVGTMPAAIEGEGGDAATYKVARVGYSFGVAEDDWLAWMKNNYNPRCEPPWAEKELRKKVENGYTYPPGIFGWRLADSAELPKVDDSDTPKKPGAFFYVVDSVSDLDLAKEWLVVAQRDLLSIGGGLQIYEAGHWAPVDNDTILEWVRDELHGAMVEVFGKLKRLSLSVKKQNDIAKGIARVAPKMPLDEFEEKRRPGIAAKDKTYLIDSKGQLIVADHSRDQSVGQFLDVDLSTKPQCPKWRQFLDELFEGAEDQKKCVDFLQEFLGVTMCGFATTFDKSVWLLGGGSNGKSTFLKAVEALLFEQRCLSYSPPHNWRDPFERIQLRKSLLNVVSEIEEKALFNTSEIKAIISGDTTRARNLHQDFVAFAPKAGHIFAANRMPPVSGDYGFWRRTVLIGFNRCFVESAMKREGLKASFMFERAGVVLWALRGAARAIGRGHYEIPPSSLGNVKEWQAAADNVVSFIESCVDVGEGFSSVNKLYEAFCLWYFDQSGDHPKIHKRRFAKRLSELGYERIRQSNARGFSLELREKKDWVDYGS